MAKVLVLCAVLTSLALIEASALPAPRPIKIPMQVSEPNLDPTQVQDFWSLWVARQLNCQLIRQEGRSIVMDAAESVTMELPTLYRIQLKRNLKFSDGSMLTSQDVVASLQHLKTKRGVLTNIFQWVKRIHATDPTTVKIELTRAVPQFLSTIASPNYSIFPKSFLEGARSEPTRWRKLVGCGRYKIEGELSAGKTVRLEPTSGQGAKLEFIPKPAGGFSASALAEFDIVDGSFPGAESELKSYEQHAIFDPKQVFVGINTKLPKFRNRAARCEAFAKIQTDPIVAAYGSSAEKATSLFPRGVIGYQSGNFSPPTSHSPTPTASLKTDCVAFLGLSIPDSIRPAYLKSLSGNEKTAKAEVLTSATDFGPNLVKLGCEFNVIALKSNTLDGYDYLLSFAERSANYTGFQSAAIAAKIRSSQSVRDTVDRAQQYQEVEALIRRECIVMPLITIPMRTFYIRPGLLVQQLGKVPINELAFGESDGQSP